MAASPLTHCLLLAPQGASAGKLNAFVAAAADGRVEAVKAAVAAKVPVNGLSTESGLSALHAAVAAKQADVVVALLDAGANPNCLDRQGRSVLFLCAERGTAAILRLLLKSRAIASLRAPDGETAVIALVVANEGDAEERLQVLLAERTTDLAVVYNGKTVEQWAVDRPSLCKLIQVEARLARLTPTPCGCLRCDGHASGHVCSCDVVRADLQLV